MVEEHRSIRPVENSRLEVAIFDVSNNAATKSIAIGYEMNLPRYIRYTKGSKPFVRDNDAPLRRTSIGEGTGKTWKSLGSIATMQSRILTKIFRWSEET